MIKIVADSKIPFLKGALDEVANVTYVPGNLISRDHLTDADAIIVRTRTACNEKLLQGTAVKFIASATIGYDHIDLGFCAANGIGWTSAPGCNANSVRQYIAAALAEILGREKKSFSDITLGIIGAGNVGSGVLALAETLGIRTLVNDPPRERIEGSEVFSSVDKLLSASDIITMHVPLNQTGRDKTYHMANHEFFDKMKKGAWFINTSRGEVMETLSLIRALKTDKLAGVVLDVWEDEPEINRELLEIAQIATPHIAGYSADGKARGTAMSVQAVSKFFNLGLDNWHPKSIPPAVNQVLQVDCNNKSPEAVFGQISTLACDILETTKKLKESPETFEFLRETYPIRREPQYLKVYIEGDCSNAINLIRDLGYQLE
jgi:erythronate-4-phosphate dehydrogenase